MKVPSKIGVYLHESSVVAVESAGNQQLSSWVHDMTSEQRLLFLQYLFATAWADGELADEEREILRTMIYGAELSPETAQICSGWFDQRPDEPDWEYLARDSAMRTIMMRQAMVLAGSDMEFSSSEIAYLDRLRERTQMDTDEYYSIWKEVEKLLAQGRAKD